MKPKFELDQEVVKLEDLKECLDTGEKADINVLDSSMIRSMRKSRSGISPAIYELTRCIGDYTERELIAKEDVAQYVDLYVAAKLALLLWRAEHEVKSFTNRRDLINARFREETL